MIYCQWVPKGNCGIHNQQKYFPILEHCEDLKQLLAKKHHKEQIDFCFILSRLYDPFMPTHCEGINDFFIFAVEAKTFKSTYDISRHMTLTFAISITSGTLFRHSMGATCFTQKWHGAKPHTLKSTMWGGRGILPSFEAEIWWNFTPSQSSLKSVKLVEMSQI